MKRVSLNIQPREERRRRPARKLRASGRIPAIVYGKSGNRNISIDKADFHTLWKQIRGTAVLVELQETEQEPILSAIQEIQRDTGKDEFIHIDFHEVTQDKPITAHVAFHFEGESVGVKNDGGILDPHVHEITVRCLPKDLPEYIKVDVTHLKVGDAIHIKNLSEIPGVYLPGDPNTALISCSASRVAKTAESEESEEEDS